MARREYLGRGMKFPPQLDPATGRFKTVSAEESVKESVYLILMTQKTERMVRQNFGSSILSYTFMDTTDTMMNMMARELQADILMQEPRISNLNIEMEPNRKKGCLFINISYELAESHTQDSLVFPFYLNADTEGEEDGE